MDEIRNYRGSTPLASKLFIIRYLHKLDGKYSVNASAEKSG
jgi:hypothetical protein